MLEVYAHSLVGQPLALWEPLADHQLAVGDLARRFTEHFGWSKVAQISGLLDDIGKLAPEFQAYIRQQAVSGGDHSSAGARIALDTYRSPLGATAGVNHCSPPCWARGWCRSGDPDGTGGGTRSP